MRRRPLLLALPLLVALLAVQGRLASSTRLAGWTVLALVVVGLYALLRAVPGRPLSLGAVYFFAFGLFHASLLPYLLAGTGPQINPYVEGLLLHSPLLAAAITSVAVALAAYLTGYAVALRGAAPVDAPLPTDSAPPAGGAELVGLAFAAGGVALWYLVVLSTSPALFTGSYGQFLAATAARPLPLAYLAIGLGLGLLGGARSPRVRTAGVLVFGVFALPAFVIGLRGEVILPALAAVVTLARRRRLRLRPWMAAALVATLSAGSLVRQVRSVGLGGAGDRPVSLNPLGGLAELGYSMRPLVVVHEWHDAWHESFIGWGVYWAPVQRLLVGRLLGLPVPDPGTDPRVFSASVAARVGQIGGSPAAEAYHAAGTAGVVLVMLAIGAAVGLLDRAPAGARVEPLVGALGFALLLWVRNDVTPMAATALIGLALLVVIRVVDALLARRRSPGQPPGAAVASAAPAGTPRPARRSAGLTTRTWSTR